MTINNSIDPRTFDFWAMIEALNIKPDKACEKMGINDPSTIVVTTLEQSQMLRGTFCDLPTNSTVKIALIAQSDAFLEEEIARINTTAAVFALYYHLTTDGQRSLLVRTWKRCWAEIPTRERREKDLIQALKTFGERDSFNYVLAICEEFIKEVSPSRVTARFDIMKSLLTAVSRNGRRGDLDKYANLLYMLTTFFPPVPVEESTKKSNVVKMP